MEASYYFFNDLLYFIEFNLDVLSLLCDLLFLIDYSLFFSLQLTYFILLLVVAHFGEILVEFDLIIKILIIVLISVIFLTQHVDIVIQTIILFLCLDVSRDNFFEVLDSARLFDLGEGVLDYLSILDILVYEYLFLFVNNLDFLDTLHQNGNWVCELLLLTWTTLLILSNLEAFVIKFN